MRRCAQRGVLSPSGRGMKKHRRVSVGFAALSSKKHGWLVKRQGNTDRARVGGWGRAGVPIDQRGSQPPYCPRENSGEHVIIGQHDKRVLFPQATIVVSLAATLAHATDATPAISTTTAPTIILYSRRQHVSRSPRLYVIYQIAYCTY